MGDESAVVVDSVGVRIDSGGELGLCVFCDAFRKGRGWRWEIGWGEGRGFVGDWGCFGLVCWQGWSEAVEAVDVCGLGGHDLNSVRECINLTLMCWCSLVWRCFASLYCLGTAMSSVHSCYRTCPYL